ncbi:hypothetical protein ACFE04_032005 [Oxalis oulophora]
MWLSQKSNAGKKGTRNGLVAVAIDKDKNSQHALKWAIDNLLTRKQTVILIHIISKGLGHNSGLSQGYDYSATPPKSQQMKDLFLSFHCYCTRKDIHCLDVVLEDVDIAKGMTEYVSYAAIEHLVLGATRHGIFRKFKSDLPSTVSKQAPDFCNVYIISKGKVSSVRTASCPAPFASPIQDKLQKPNDTMSDTSSMLSMSLRDNRLSFKPRRSVDSEAMTPFARGRGIPGIPFADFSDTDTDISFVSSGRPSSDRPSSVALDYCDSARTSRISTSSEQSIGSMRFGLKFPDQSPFHDFSYISQDSARTSSYSQNTGSMYTHDEVDEEMRRLKLELKQTMDMYSTACKEALTAKSKAMELERWKNEEVKKLAESKISEQSAVSIIENEREKCKAAIEAADAAKQAADLEAQRRVNTENRALTEAEEIQRTLDNLAAKNVRYRRYSIEEIKEATENFAESRKIGEGGYGPVYKCVLDHTPSAVKVLRPDAAQGMSQFQQEIEVLSCIRHPNMVLLLGACPEYGILVYEYMANGSLDDRLFQRGDTPPLPWQLRFRIAAEIVTGLLFLHQTKPEPIVHRDLKPGNILLDYNYVSKISDVGLARLVPVVAENVTQCRITSTAGTFCYIDPEYQQTGMLGVKSDVYSLGIMLLQLITAKQPMGLTHYVERSIEKGTFKEMLDPAVPNWPIDEALTFAKLCLQCAELRRKDRPDLGNVVLPELCRLRNFAEENISFPFASSAKPSFQSLSQVSMSRQEVMSDSQILHSGSTKSVSSTELAEEASEAAEES